MKSWKVMQMCATNGAGSRVIGQHQVWRLLFVWDKSQPALH